MEATEATFILRRVTRDHREIACQNRVSLPGEAVKLMKLHRETHQPLPSLSRAQPPFNFNILFQFSSSISARRHVRPVAVEMRGVACTVHLSQCEASRLPTAATCLSFFNPPYDSLSDVFHSHNPEDSIDQWFEPSF